MREREAEGASNRGRESRKRKIVVRLNRHWKHCTVPAAVRPLSVSVSVLRLVRSLAVGSTVVGFVL